MAKRTCSAPGCPGPVKAKGLCWKHYLRVRRTGSIEGARLPTEARFFTFVREEPSGCWQWTGYLGTSGYGNFAVRTVGKVKAHRAHRWSFEHFVGPVPDGLQLDHLCRNRGCVNWRHLEPVTAQENTLRSLRARQSRQE